MYVIGLKRVLRFEYVGVSCDLLLIAIVSSSSYITAAWRSINSDSNAHMDALSYLDFIVILRLARWTRRVFLMELKKHMLVS